MSQKVSLIVYPAADLEAAKTFYGKFLQTEPYVDGPYYVGYKVDNMEVGLDPNGQEVVAYIEVSDIKGSLSELIEAGSTLHQDVRDVGGGLQIAQVKDAAGNILGLRQVA